MTLRAAIFGGLIGLVAAGIGVALVPISVSLLHRPGVVYRPLSGRAPTVELALAWRSGPLSPVVAAFPIGDAAIGA